MEPVIVHTADTLGGKPRLNGRRLDVGHVIWGITEYDNGRMETYLKDFDVTKEQFRHAIMYCKDEICELDDCLVSCNGCSKKFKNDYKDWDEYIKANGEVESHESGQFHSQGENTLLLGSLEDHKNDFLGTNNWEKAEQLYKKLKNKLDLPNSYEKLLNENKFKKQWWKLW